MSNRIKRMQKRIKRIPDTGEVKYNHEIMVHGKMVYECEKCGRRWNMYLEKGLEEFERDHKPTPFVIRCRCGGPAKDIFLPLLLYSPSCQYQAFLFFENLNPAAFRDSFTG